MIKITTIYISLFFICQINILHAEDRLELQTTIIKGNKELPQILYVVPWQDVKRSKKKEQQLVLYSLFGDLFEPVNPEELAHKIIK